MKVSIHFPFRFFALLAWLLAFYAPGKRAYADSSLALREPAVAGLFYPKNPRELTLALDAYLAAAKPPPADKNLKALITPHAGYAYSGPVAAQAFRLLEGRHYSTVIVMGPSHYALLTAASLSPADAYRTPLGEVPVSPKVKTLGKLRPFEIAAPATVERPTWWRQSSRGEPTTSEQENAETWEHSVEVEIPFLQKTLGSFSLIPVVIGDVDTAQAGRSLGQVVDDDTLIIASSDLSHYHSYAEARQLDHRGVDAILHLDTRRMEDQEACGKNPILTLLHLAKERGWKPRLLDLRNSGDTAGDKQSVVGYAAVAFYAENETAETTYSADEQRLLLKLARGAVTAAALGQSSPQAELGVMPEKLQAKRGTFITLTKGGELRGCIGRLGAEKPLYQDLLDNARAAAVDDPRFPAVSSKELDRLEIEVSVLTALRPLPFESPEDLLNKLRPHQDGVVLRIGHRTATYLPQVWEQIGDKIEFLNTLAEKAGCPADAWRGRGVSVATYQVESFSEAQLGRP